MLKDNDLLKSTFSEYYGINSPFLMLEFEKMIFYYGGLMLL